MKNYYYFFFELILRHLGESQIIQESEYLLD